MIPDGDLIASCVLHAFDCLPKKAKPRAYEDGKQEWVPLSGIVLSIENHQIKEQAVGSAATSSESFDLHCVALGTGMRCLPASKIPSANGACLHDWHAEVVAMRAFNLFLLQECAKFAAPDATSRFVRRLNPQLSPALQSFAIQDGVRIYMYCSEAPCGDASMELTMNLQDDPTPWAEPSARNESTLGLRGRGFFSELGIVRRKPSRGDAPETLSKSCSDKLSMRQCVSLLSSVTSTLIRPDNAYIAALVLPKSQHVPAATERAFSSNGRMAGLAKNEQEGLWRGGYAYRPFQISITTVEFQYSRRAQAAQKALGSNITAMWTPGCQEVLVGGTIQGFKQFAIRGSSAISKERMWRFARDIVRQTPATGARQSLEQENYHEVKASPYLESRRAVKAHVRATALHNWICNQGGDGFSLEVGVRFPATSQLVLLSKDAPE